MTTITITAENTTDIDNLPITIKKAVATIDGVPITTVGFFDNIADSEIDTLFRAQLTSLGYQL